MDWHDFLSGYGGPLLAGIFGVAGVVLGRFIAQGIKKDGEERINGRVNLALTLLFSLAALGYVREYPDTSPMRLLGYGTASGFIGLPLLELFADQFMARFRNALEGFMRSPHDDDDDDEKGITRAMDKLNEIEEVPGGPSN